MAREDKPTETGQRQPKVDASLKPAVLFTYSTARLAKKDKVRFFYAFKGRASKPGVLKESNARMLGRAVIIVSSAQAKRIERFLTEWKCEFKQQEVLVEE